MSLSDLTLLNPKRAKSLQLVIADTFSENTFWTIPKKKNRRKNPPNKKQPINYSLCRKRGYAKGDRSLFSVSVTFW